MTNHCHLYSCTIRRAAALVFFASLSSLLCIAGQTSRNVPSLENGGLHALALTVENRAKSQDFVSIVSDRTLKKTVNEEDRKRIEEDRKLGRSIMAAVDATTSSTTVSFEDVSDLMEIRRWLLQKPGYGNLVVCYAIEDAVCKVLFQQMSSPDCETAKALPFIETLAEESPSSAYWLEVLRMEGESFTAKTKYPTQKEDCFRLAEIIHALNDRSQEHAVQDGNRQGGGDGYAGCYETYMPAQVGLLLVQTSVFKSAVEAFYEVRKNVKAIPENQAEFIELLDQHATTSMQKKNRLGGRIDGASVWHAWRTLVETTVQK